MAPSVALAKGATCAGRTICSTPRQDDRHISSVLAESCDSCPDKAQRQQTSGASRPPAVGAVPNAQRPLAARDLDESRSRCIVARQLGSKAGPLNACVSRTQRSTLPLKHRPPRLLLKACSGLPRPALRYDSILPVYNPATRDLGVSYVPCAMAI